MALPSYDPPESCTPPARFYVQPPGGNRVRLPIINDGALVRITRNGPTDVTRYGEVYFPAVWTDGNDYAQVFEDPNGLNAIGEIEIYDEATETYRTIHRGIVLGVGGSSGSANEMRATVRDLDVMLDLPASATFNPDSAGSSDVLEYVAGRIADTHPIIDSVPVVVRGPSFDDVVSVPPDIVDRIVGTILHSSKTFTSNRDTLADVLTWASDNSTADIYFEPHEDTIALIADRGEPTTLRGTDVSGSERQIPVIHNNALFEISPVNAVRAVGSTIDPSNSIPLDGMRADPSKDTYAYAIAEHPPSVSRAGQRVTDEVSIEASNLSSVKENAESSLREMIEGGGRGNIVCELTGEFELGSIFRAVPICDGISPNVDPIRYSVEGIVHQAKARSYDGSDPANVPYTQLEVSQEASDIEIVESGYRGVEEINVPVEPPNTG